MRKANELYKFQAPCPDTATYIQEICLASQASHGKKENVKENVNAITPYYLTL